MSRFYGFPVFDLPNAQKIALMTSMGPLEAEERLKAGGGDMDADQLRDAVLEATGDEDLAEELALKRAEQLVKREDGKTEFDL